MEPRLKGDWGIRPGDVVQTKKKHPCSGDLWEVLREGMDVKIRCLNCGRTVSLVRQEFIRRVKKVVSVKEEERP